MDEISKKYDNENPTDEEIKKMSDEIDSKSKRYDIEVYI
jgi:hypothetical protein